MNILKRMQKNYIDHIITEQTVFDAGKYKQVYTAKPLNGGKPMIENSLQALDERLKKQGAA